MKKGQLVRLKKGLYTGDLAKIVYIYPDMYEVVLKLVPRLEKIDEDLTPDEIKKRSIK